MSEHTADVILNMFRPRHILEDARENAYHREREDYRVFVGAGDHYEFRPGPHPTLVGEVLLAVFDRVRDAAAVLTCRAVGHAYRDGSWANSETGGVGWACDRCGSSHHVTLY